MTQDPLARLAVLPGVPEALAAATAAVDAVLWDRSVRSRGAEVTARSVILGGAASAALEGAEVPLDAVDDSPVGRVVQAAVRVTTEVPALAATVGQAPAQAIARLAATAATGFVPAEELGRPRQGLEADDPLHLGPLPAPGEVSARLNTLVRLLAAPTEAPALVVASVVHGELLALRPFTWGSGLVARAAFRLVLGARGADPDLVGVPEEALARAGRPAYARAAQGFIAGTPEGLAAWIDLQCRAVAQGATLAT